MVVVVDIGNSRIHLGVYNKNRQTYYDSYEHMIQDPIFPIIRAMRIHKAGHLAISSVVPDLTRVVMRKVRMRTGVRPFIVTHKVRTGLTMPYRKPETLGTDRIVNIVAGLTRYKCNVIVVDFGTAITIDVALKKGEYRGGIILPGAQTILGALSENTALLKSVSFQRPRRLIGKSTDECIRSGIFYGTIHAVDGLIGSITRTMKREFTCIATGGWGKTFARYCRKIDHYNKDLTLYGILKTYRMNVE